MNRDLLHTPDGVRDIYGAELSRKRRVQDSIRDLMLQSAFSLIDPPTFEFFDVFAKEISGWSARELFKFFDKEGNTLVLRPDFTPQIARCISKYFLDDGTVVRLCYEGDTFVNTSELKGKLKQTNLQDFQISAGHAAFFQGICEESGLNEVEESAIRALIADNNYFAAEQMMRECGIDEHYREILLKISDFVGSAKDLELVPERVNNETSRAALRRLIAVYEALEQRGVQQYVSFDLGMLSKHNYYTGITFEAYTYGVGDAIAKGGRYDRLLGHFGHNAPAIGFAVMIDDLMRGLP